MPSDQPDAPPAPTRTGEGSAAPSLRSSKKEESRRRIAQTALRLFLERGFEQVSVAEVAEAARVSKMTVFNYFPAKEDLFFEFIHDVMPDLGAVVRDRPAGLAPISAVHRFVRAELERRAEWTGLHDGVADFARVVFRSPTLISGFDRIWREREHQLLDALAETAGVPAARAAAFDDLAETLTRPGRGSAVERSAAVQPGPGAAPALDSDAVILRVVVGQILATIQTLVMVNQYRQSLGTSADDTAELSLAECDTAFSLLERGLAGYAT